jgi:hypothetical protein
MKNFLQSLFLLVVLVLPLYAASEDELKITHKMLGDAARTGNFDLLVPMIHPQALGFMRKSQMVVQLRSGYGVNEMLPPLIVDLSRFLVTPYETIYRVIGETGIVCMTINAKPIAVDPKTKKKGEERYSRATYVYSKTDSGWKLISWHTSETPLKN